jgi:hypothetical protein
LIDMPRLLPLTVASATLMFAAPIGATPIRTHNREATIIHVTVRRVQRPPQETGPIACTRLGCHHIPAGCHPEMIFNFWGDPTGYEKVVCPDDRR